MSWFLIFCSGANREIISKTPSEKSKYAAIGGTVLFTGLFSALAGGFTFYQIFAFDSNFIFYEHLLTASVIFGFVWGIMIFNLDRYIVMSLKKDLSWWFQILMAIPRLLIASVISVVIALPLEVKIFESKILAFLQEQKREYFNSETAKTKGRHAANAKEVEQIDQQIVQYKVSLSDKPAEYYIFAEDLSKCNEEVSITRSNSQIERTTLNGEIENIRLQILEVQRNDTSYLTNPKYVSFSNQILIKQKRLSYLTKQISEVEKRCRGLTFKMNQIQRQHEDNLRDIIADLEHSKIQLDSIGITLYSNYLQDSSEVFGIAEQNFQGNFITQVESFGALLKKDKENGYYFLWLASVAISALFLLIDSAPVIVKLLSSSSSYDKVHAKDQEKEVELNRVLIDKILSIEKNKIESDKEFTEKYIKNRKIKYEEFIVDVQSQSDELLRGFLFRLKEQGDNLLQKLLSKLKEEKITYSEAANNLIRDFISTKVDQPSTSNSSNSGNSQRLSIRAMFAVSLLIIVGVLATLLGFENTIPGLEERLAIAGIFSGTVSTFAVFFMSQHLVRK